MTERKLIPWARPALVGREQSLVQDALESSWISGGPYVELFEDELSKFLGVECVSMCSNGTTAIELSLLALTRDERDEVIVPAFGYLAAANAALRGGFRVVFADVDPETWNLTPESVSAVITARTLCVIVIHSYGIVADIEGIMRICESQGVTVIEDSAEALGSKRSGRSAGTFAEFGTFSFQATKTVTTGEGGAVCSQDKALIDSVNLYKSHGVTETRYLHKVPGGNSRITNLQAAVGVAQLEVIDFLLEERRRIHYSYKELLGGRGDFLFQSSQEDCDPVVWASALCFSSDCSERKRDEIMKVMQNEHKIETRPGFYAASRHEYFGHVSCPQADYLSQRTLVLPGFVGMTDSELERVSTSLIDTVNQVKVSQ